MAVPAPYIENDCPILYIILAKIENPAHISSNIMKRKLGFFERALLISDRYAPFHIVSVLRLANAPEPHAIRRSLQLLQSRHPFLSARLLEERGVTYFASLVEPRLPLKILPRWNDEHWIQLTEVELENRIDLTTGPMFRCTYLYNSDQPQAEIIFAISHFIADSASVSRLMQELLTNCASASDKNSHTVKLLSPAPPAESRFPSAFRGVSLSMRKMRYAAGQMADEISHRLQTRGKRTPPVHEKKSRGHILSAQFPEDLIEPFAQRARRERVTLNSALNAALMLAVNRHLYAGQRLSMRTFAFADLRPYVQPPLEPENFACYISMLRYTVTVAGGMDFWSLARDLHGKMYSSFKSGEKFIANAMAEPLMKMVTQTRAFRMGATALNYNGVVPIRSDYGEIKVLGVYGFVSVFDLGPELSSQAQWFGDQLFWDFMYLEADMNREEAGVIVEEIMSIVRLNAIS
ncbi:MAG: hypothetical protein FIB03_11435 [Anaerolineae bacterium]|nr:hypothetical protein [Anaerolineae bacterium]